MTHLLTSYGLGDAGAAGAHLQQLLGVLVLVDKLGMMGDGKG